jgi:hypothetical protein
VDGSKPKPIAPTKACATPLPSSLPSTRLGSIVDWKDRNMFAQRIMINGVKNYFLHHTTRSNTTKERWDELETTYQVHNISNCVYLKNKPISLKMEDDKSISKHIHVFRTILDELIAIGATIDVDEQIEFLLENIYDYY